MLQGLRVHAWVLVKAGSREVPETFLIDALSGRRIDLASDALAHFYGVESVWNGKNVWVNMQSCKFGIASLKYDFNDNSLWESFFAPKELDSIFESIYLLNENYKG